MDTVSLDLVKEGVPVTVQSIEGGGWVRRLYQMGIVPGSKLVVLLNRGRGPLIVKVGEVEVSLGRGIARRILVKVEQS